MLFEPRCSYKIEEKRAYNYEITKDNVSVATCLKSFIFQNHFFLLIYPKLFSFFKFVFMLWL